MFGLAKNMDKIYNFYMVIEDMFVLNLLWIFCSLPIVTAGASTAGLLYALHERQATNDLSIIKLFFEGFRQQFIKHSVIHIVYLTFLIVSVSNLIHFKPIGLLPVGLYVLNVWGVVALFFSWIHIYHVSLVYKQSLLESVKLSILFAIRYLPFTILMLFFTVSCLIATLRWGFIGFAIFYIIGYFNVRLWRRRLKMNEPAVE